MNKLSTSVLAAAFLPTLMMPPISWGGSHFYNTVENYYSAGAGERVRVPPDRAEEPVTEPVAECEADCQVVLRVPTCGRSRQPVARPPVEWWYWQSYFYPYWEYPQGGAMPWYPDYQCCSPAVPAQSEPQSSAIKPVQPKAKAEVAKPQVSKKQEKAALQCPAIAKADCPPQPVVKKPVAKKVEPPKPEKVVKAPKVELPKKEKVAEVPKVEAPKVEPPKKVVEEAPKVEAPKEEAIPEK